MKPNLVFSGARRRSFMTQTFRRRRSYRQLGRALVAVPERDHHPGHGHGGDDRGQNAETERDGEAAHRAGAEEIQDDRGDEHRDVRIDDRREGAPEACVERGDDRAAEMRFLADALVDQHVGIDGHADREDDAGNAGQGQRRAEQGHRGEDEEDMHAQREIGEDAEDAVGRQHVDDDQRAADHRGAFSGVDRILAEAGADGALFDHGQLRRQRAGAQQHGEVVGLLDREIAGDLARAAGDRPQDARRRNHLAVEHDGERPADILAGHLAEALAAAQIETEIDVWLAVLVEARLRVDQVLALHHHPFFDRDRRAAILLRQFLDLVRRLAGLGDEAEFQLGGGAENLLEPGRVLQARHLYQDAVGAFLLDVRLGRAERVDAAAQHFDRLRDGASNLVLDRRIGERHLDRALVGLVDVERMARRADHGVADRLVELPQKLQRLVALRGVGDPHLNAALLHGDAAGDRYSALAQLAADIVAQLLDLRMGQRGAVHFEQNVRAALQVEPEHDLPRRQDGRQAFLQGGDALRRKEARHDEQNGHDDQRDDGGDPPGGETKHWTSRSPRAFSLTMGGGLRSRFADRFLDRLAPGADLADAGPGDAHAHIGRDLDLDFAVIGRLGDLADKAAGRDDRIAAPRALEHLLMLAGAALLRAQDQEIHDRENDDERRELDEHILRPGRAARGLGECWRNQQRLNSDWPGSAPGAHRASSGAEYSGGRRESNRA